MNYFRHKHDSKIGEVIQFHCRNDNYGYLVVNSSDGRAVAIDSPDPEMTLEILSKESLSLTYILNTHWHEDHIGGNGQLKEATGARVIAPAVERMRIPTTDIAIHHGAVIFVGPLSIHALETAGHTLGHLSYHVPLLKSVFTGDALFTMGCGRLFEGSAHMAWNGLQRLASLPDDTKVYCAHEYGHSNAAFALSNNNDAEVMARAAAITIQYGRNIPSVPSSIGLERRTNPFLRLPLAEQAHGASAVLARFAGLRALKDNF